MKKEIKTTLWLDLLTYIIIPFVLLIGSINIIRALLYGVINIHFFIFLFIEVAFLTFYGFTFYHSYKRNKDAYMLLRLLILITSIQAGLDFANTQNINSGHSFILSLLGYLIVIAIVWIYPNEIYFKNRKNLFVNKSTLNFINRCSKCKKFYLNAEECPKCNN